tara:strand:- start:1433 stop:1597 length:165 start_codon:yes stop_codon:yes gene_type:complete
VLLVEGIGIGFVKDPDDGLMNGFALKRPGWLLSGKIPAQRAKENNSWRLTTRVQ